VFCSGIETWRGLIPPNVGERGERTTLNQKGRSRTVVFHIELGPETRW